MKGCLCMLLAVLGVGWTTASWPSFSALLKGVTKIPSLVTFGDSVTDSGNTFDLSNFTFPYASVYFEGRFSDAPGTWADAVQNTTKPFKANVTNNAFAGATCCYYPNLTTTDAGVPSMVFQVDAYIKRTDRPKGKKVIVLWGGHNDVIGGLALPPGEVPAVPKAVVGCLVKMAEKLLKADSEATVLIASIAPLHTTPFLFGIQILEPFVDTLNQAINAVTLALAFRYPNRIAYWDVSTVLKKTIAGATALGFKYKKVPCITYKSSYADLRPGNNTLELKSKCSNPDEYIYFDSLHVTSKVHAIVAASYFEKLLELKLISKVPTISKIGGPFEHSKFDRKP